MDLGGNLRLNQRAGENAIPDAGGREVRREGRQGQKRGGASRVRAIRTYKYPWHSAGPVSRDGLFPPVGSLLGCLSFHDSLVLGCAPILPHTLAYTHNNNKYCCWWGTTTNQHPLHCYTSRDTTTTTTSPGCRGRSLLEALRWACWWRRWWCWWWVYSARMCSCMSMCLSGRSVCVCVCPKLSVTSVNKTMHAQVHKCSLFMDGVIT